DFRKIHLRGWVRRPAAFHLRLRVIRGMKEMDGETELGMRTGPNEKTEPDLLILHDFKTRGRDQFRVSQNSVGAVVSKLPRRVDTFSDIRNGLRRGSRNSPEFKN